MKPEHAIEILKSQPVATIDESSCLNVEDSEVGAVVVLTIAMRDEIVGLLRLAIPSGSGREQCAVESVFGDDMLSNSETARAALAPSGSEVKK